MTTITKDMVEARMEALRADLDKLKHRYSAVEGAILDCEFWLAKFAQATQVNGEDSELTPHTSHPQSAASA